MPRKHVVWVADAGGPDGQPSAVDGDRRCDDGVELIGGGMINMALLAIPPADVDGIDLGITSQAEMDHCRLLAFEGIASDDARDPPLGAPP